MVWQGERSVPFRSDPLRRVAAVLLRFVSGRICCAGGLFPVESIALCAPVGGRHEYKHDADDIMGQVQTAAPMMDRFPVRSGSVCCSLRTRPLRNSGGRVEWGAGDGDGDGDGAS